MFEFHDIKNFKIKTFSSFFFTVAPNYAENIDDFAEKSTHR